MGGNFSINDGKKRVGKDKGKGVAISSGLKVKRIVLKLSNSLKLGSNSSNPFDDGSKIGSKVSKVTTGPVMFKAVTHGLDIAKHHAVQMSMGKGIDLINSKLPKRQSAVFGELIPVERPTFSSGMDFCENFGQIQASMGDAEDRLSPVDRAMEKVLSGIYKAVEQDTAMTTESSNDVELPNENA